MVVDSKASYAERPWSSTHSAPEDFLVRAARVIFFAGLFMVSLLVLRVGGGIAVGDVLLMASAALLALAPRARPAARLTLAPRTVVVAGLLLLGAALATSVSDDPFDSAQVALRVAYVALVLPWQSTRLLNSPEKLSQAFVAFGLGAAVCGLGALAQYRFGYSIIPGTVVTEAGRYPGFTGHVSDTGGITCLAIIIGVGGLRRRTSKSIKVFSLVVLTSGVIGLVLSGSVSGMLSAVAGLLVIVVLRGVPLSRMLLIAAMASGALLIADQVIASTQYALSPTERIMQTMGLANTSDAGLNTTASRLDTDRLGLTGFLEHPLTGVGLDTQASVVDSYHGFAVHNFLIGALYQGGLLFGAGVGLGVLLMVVPALRRIQRTGPGIMALATAGTALVFAVTAPSFFNRYFWIPLAFLAAQTALGDSRSPAASPQ